MIEGSGWLIFCLIAGDISIADSSNGTVAERSPGFLELVLPNHFERWGTCQWRRQRWAGDVVNLGQWLHLFDDSDAEQIETGSHGGGITSP